MGSRLFCQILIVISAILFAYVSGSFGIDFPGNSSEPGTGTIIPEFNHLYIVLQQSSIDSIARTPFISEEFSAFEQRKVDAGDDSWFGSYLIGQNAYLEFFGPSGGFEGSIAGEAGIGLSTRKLGQFQTAKSALLSLAGDRAEDGMRVRVLGEDTTSWFYWVNIKTSDSCAFFAWLMECTEDYLGALGINVDSSKNFSRHDYLTAKVTPSDVVPTGSTMFYDVVEIDLELNKFEYSDFELLTQALGIKPRIETGSAHFDIGNCVVNVMRNEMRKYCIRRIVCTMIKPADSPIDITFGPDAGLEVDGNQAIWYFGL